MHICWAEEAVSIKTDWNGFQQQVARRRLDNRKARISLTTGETVSVFFLNASDRGLVVRSEKSTQQWSTKGSNALVPRSLVSGVEFSGKTGRGGLIGGLIGLGAGAGATAASASAGQGNCEGSTCAGALLWIPALAAGGYFIGRATSKPTPSFVIQH